jgi:acyl carrier protein phosphodiesterase
VNYLAHLLLAGNEEGSVVGNFLGDFVKGKLGNKNYSQEIINGIKMHRRIDAIADQKIYSLLNEKLLDIENRRYAGITFDLACDHFLAKHWKKFSDENHHHFSESRLIILKNSSDIIEERAQLVLQRMEDYEWLKNYGEMDFMEEVFRGIHKRFPRKNSIDKAFMDLENNYETMELICSDFIAELSNQFLNK